MRIKADELTESSRRRHLLRDDEILTVGEPLKIDGKTDGHVLYDEHGNSLGHFWREELPADIVARWASIDEGSKP